MPRTGQPAIRHVAAVQRAVAVLDALAEDAPELGTNEIARRTGINPSTVSRLLATLAEAGLVDHVAESGRYRLGLRLLQLGNAVLARLDLREITRPHLVSLVEETGESATLSAPGEHEAVTVDFARSPAAVQYVARLGRPSVAHATAVGKVYLAHGGALPEGPLHAYTPNTITDRRALAVEIERVRDRGYAEVVCEREEDLNAVAAPILGSRGELVAILGVQGPAARFGRREMQVAVGSLLEHAAAISEALGHPAAGAAA
jgi:IclR family acetate operon transcriptional repressor